MSALVVVQQKNPGEPDTHRTAERAQTEDIFRASSAHPLGTHTNGSAAALGRVLNGRSRGGNWAQAADRGAEKGGRDGDAPFGLTVGAGE